MTKISPFVEFCEIIMTVMCSGTSLSQIIPSTSDFLFSSKKNLEIEIHFPKKNLSNHSMSRCCCWCTFHVFLERKQTKKTPEKLFCCLCRSDTRNDPRRSILYGLKVKPFLKKKHRHTHTY